MAPHSNTLAWKTPWTEEPDGLQSMGSLRVGHDWATLILLFTFHFHALEKETATHSSVLAWRIPGTGEPGGLPSMGSHRVGHGWSDSAAAAAAATQYCKATIFWAPLGPILCDLMNCSPPGPSVHGIFQARILEWVAISYSRGSSQPRDWTLSSCISCIGRWILYHCAT